MPRSLILSDFWKDYPNLHYYFGTRFCTKLICVVAVVSDRTFESSVSRQLAIFLFDEPYEYKDISFDWYSEKIFFETMYVDFFDGNEDLLLELLYGFMKKYNDAVIWIEQDWFYFYEDIIKIKQEPFNSLWCYKNLHS